jgi:hypothetical protein
MMIHLSVCSHGTIMSHPKVLERKLKGRMDTSSNLSTLSMFRLRRIKSVASIRKVSSTILRLYI